MSAHRISMLLIIGVILIAFGILDDIEIERGIGIGVLFTTIMIACLRVRFTREADHE